MDQWATCTLRFSPPPLTAVLNHPVSFPRYSCPVASGFCLHLCSIECSSFFLLAAMARLIFWNKMKTHYSQVSFIARRACVQIPFSSLPWWTELENAAASWSLPSSPLRLRTQPVLSSQSPASGSAGLPQPVLLLRDKGTSCRRHTQLQIVLPQTLLPR